jgi:Peptidase C13 family
VSQEPPEQTPFASRDPGEITAPPAESGNAVRPAPMFLTNLANGFRLALFRRVEEDLIRVAWWQVAAFGLASLFIPVVYNVASIGLNGEFEASDLPSAMAHVPLILLTAIVAACVLGRSEKTLLLLQTFLTIAVAIDLAVFIPHFAVQTLYLDRLPPALIEWYSRLPPLWLAAACGRAAANLLPAARRRAPLAYAACLVLLALPLIELDQERDVWRFSVDDAEATPAEDDKALDEDVFYAQPAILQRELAALRPGRRGVIDVYFVGVGGHAYQDVFTKEVTAVSALFRERFGSDGKIIRLVNNPKTLADLPIASVTSLRASLKRVAQVMDKDEDVLFLFLTSHGSESHRFSLDLSSIKFHELNPATLRQALDESGIRNRVIVISACYSGGFIDPLKNETTLVISASAADRNSFGCTSEAEWTYFGKAYFDEALRRTYSFVEAFEIAKPIIAEREKKDGYKPSEPQMALGESLKPTLAKLQRQLEVGVKGKE